MSLLGRVYHTGGKAQRFKCLIIYQSSGEFDCLEAVEMNPQCKRKVAAMPLHSDRRIASHDSALPLSSQSVLWLRHYLQPSFTHSLQLTD